MFDFFVFYRVFTTLNLFILVVVGLVILLGIMYEWKWSKEGVDYPERTPRYPDQASQSHHSQHTPQQSQEQHPQQTSYIRGTSKRDATAERMAERQHIPQVSRNPFFELLNQCDGQSRTNQTNPVTLYIQDLTTQDQYLRPQDSNMSDVCRTKQTRTE